jgi:hypothetical protein
VAECAPCLLDFVLKPPHEVLALDLVLAVLLVENLSKMLYEETESPGLRPPCLGGEQTGQVWDDPGGDL